MKQKLTGLDRINIPIMLQRAVLEGNETEMTTIRELKKEIIEMVAIKQEEFEEYGIKERNGLLFWNDKIQTEKEFDLKKSYTELLKQTRQVLNDNRKITEQMLDTCIKIQKMK